ncbi:MAG: PAS domain-containing protein [bacterium]|nr:PAS domain-containing protein [Candidatus Margulisiibacteriota bacterium]
MDSNNNIKEIKELESYLKDMWLFSPIPLTYLNPAEIILDVDNSLAALLGLPKEEVVGSPLSDFFVPKEEMKRIHQETFAKGSIKNREAIIKNAQGEEIPVNVFTMVRKDAKGKPIGFFAALTDLTKIKAMQKELQNKIAELEEFRDLAVGRELKMIELEKEINSLLAKLGHKPKYET